VWHKGKDERDKRKAPKHIRDDAFEPAIQLIGDHESLFVVESVALVISKF